MNSTIFFSRILPKSVQKKRVARGFDLVAHFFSLRAMNLKVGFISQTPSFDKNYTNLSMGCWVKKMSTSRKTGESRYAWFCNTTLDKVSPTCNDPLILLYANIIAEHMDLGSIGMPSIMPSTDSKRLSKDARLVIDWRKPIQQARRKKKSNPEAFVKEITLFYEVGSTVEELLGSIW